MFYDCKRSIKVIGDGIQQYFAKSSIPSKGSNNIYPKINITSYSFASPLIAKQNFEIINKGFNFKLKDGECLFFKEPNYLFINGNEIIHLSAPAEMFRSDILKYGELINKYNQ